MEQRFVDEKERSQKRMNELILDHEVKLRDELAGHEEELEMLKAELNHANQERE